MNNFWENEDQEFETLDNMDKFGGSFVKQLAVLYRLADLNNKSKLIDTFINYFNEYKEPIQK